MRRRQGIISQAEEKKNNSEHSSPIKTKKLFINSLPLIHKVLNKNTNKKVQKRKTKMHYPTRKQSSINFNNQMFIKECKSSNFNKAKKIIDKYNNAIDYNNDEIRKRSDFNLMKFYTLKSTIVIDSNGNNNLNDEQRNLIQKYLTKMQKQKIQIKQNKCQKINSAKNKNIFLQKNLFNKNKNIRLPKKAKTATCPNSRQLFEKVDDNTKRNILNIVHDNFFSKKNDSIFEEESFSFDINDELKSKNINSSFLGSCFDDVDYYKEFLKMPQPLYNC